MTETTTPVSLLGHGDTSLDASLKGVAALSRATTAGMNTAGKLSWNHEQNNY